MRLELLQLERARQACAEEARELDRSIVRAEDALREARAAVERIRKDGAWALDQAKTWLASRETRHRLAVEELQRLQAEGAALHAFDESRLEAEKSEAQLKAGQAQMAAGQAGIPPGAVQGALDVAAWRSTEKMLGEQLEHTREEIREQVRDIEEQQKRIAKFARELAEARKEFMETEKEVRESTRRAEESARDAERAIPEVRRKRDEANRELQKIGRAFDQEEKLLWAYERAGDD